MRLDKYLAQMSVGTRSEVKKIIKSGRVFVNGIPAERPEQKIEISDIIAVDGQQIAYEEYEYYMLNKPQGYVSAVKDNTAPTVVSLIPGGTKGDLFPVGRLDKDTEGLLLITNDGALAHELLSPKKHVWKSYLVRVQGHVTEEDVRQLQEGIDIGDEKKTLPAKATLWQEEGLPAGASDVLTGVSDVPVAGGGVSEDGYTWLELAIREGRYHQIKRMMAALGKPVVYLKRLSMGKLFLDDKLEPGEFRRLTEEEKEGLQSTASKT